LEASALIDRLLVGCESAGLVGLNLRLLPLKSLILARLGEQKEALETLEQALIMAEPQGYKRSFLQYGKALVPLLRVLFEKKQHQEFILEMLTSIEVQASTKLPGMVDPMAKTSLPDRSLIESLSERELEVLQWIANGSTNREIAQGLVLSLYTVKTHASNIYSKLGVKNRTEAVSRARLLGLLD
jgi:LuxR family maltose regulon positive regulatory protein